MKFTSADKGGPFEGAPLENLYVGRIIKKPNDYTNINWSLYNFQKETIKNISIGDNILDASFFDPESCTSLEEINCYCVIPPIIPQFSVSQYINVVINIPEGTLSQYQDNSEWNKFWKLNETLSTPSVIENIILNETQLELIPTQVFQLIAIGEPENIIFDDIKWSSSDPNIASVDDDGLVTAISPGIVTITVSIGDCSASCIVTVLSNWNSIDNISFFDNVPIEVYSIDGIPLFNIVDMSEITSLPKGIYIIKNGRDTIKIIR